MTIRATYRLQFHKGFTFADAEAVLPYLARLGISHVYASPITMAQPGSTHGYDVIDPTRINPELGGEEGFRHFAAALKKHNLGLIIDIVPNHMGVAGGNNPWWQDVLAHGQVSAFAHYFDIDWNFPFLLPFLGTPLPQAIANGDLKIIVENGLPQVLAYGTTRYPVREEDHAQIDWEGPDAFTGDKLAALLGRQHYRLAWWRQGNDQLHWRRFFTITELAGMRVEEEAVFEATHSLYLRLYREGLIQGVRIDHVDGLTDPAGYCRRLRDRLGPDAWIVVEKILGPGEQLSADWGVDGTSGYDFMEEVSALLHDPAGEAPLTELWTAISRRPGDFRAEEVTARRNMLAWEFEAQLGDCVDAFVRLAADAPQTVHLTSGMLRRAIQTLLWVFPVYRTYASYLFAPADDALVLARAKARSRPYTAPGEEPVVDAVLAWLAAEGPGDGWLAADAVRRFQQLSAPIAAKAVEDTAFYRSARLLSRNDVGFDADRFALPIAEFHKAMEWRAEHWPAAMLATATHDHKRGEDSRARLAALSAIPAAWEGFAADWLAAAGPAIASADAYELLQTLVGAWPDDRDGFLERILGWQVKALREAKLRSSWAAPDEAYEARACGFAERALEGQLAEDIAAFVRRIAPAAEANGLVQAFLHFTMPGVPDLYQGCEYADLSLVDPDNRRPVDYAARAAGKGSRYDLAKQRLIATLLDLRAQYPEVFAGNYLPVAAGAHSLAFTRTGRSVSLTGAAMLHGREADWSDPALPEGDGLLDPALPVRLWLTEKPSIVNCL